MVFNVLLPLAFQSRFVRWEVADYGLQPYSFYGWESITAVQSYFVKNIFPAQTTQLFFFTSRNLFHAIQFLTCFFSVTDMLFMNNENYSVFPNQNSHFPKFTLRTYFSIVISRYKSGSKQVWIALIIALLFTKSPELLQKYLKFHDQITYI